jgi:DNA helicase-2/ATP-dependent DNA helicase PcrA
MTTPHTPTAPAPDLFAALTPAQRQVVEAPSGATLVIAGAGSGKTRALTRRVAYLLSLGVAPERVLLLTFTNKAAHELLGRAAALVGGRAASLWGGTFHNIGLRILRAHAASLGLPPDFAVLDAADTLDLLADAATAHPPLARVTPKTLQRLHSLAVNTCQGVPAAVARFSPQHQHLTPTLLAALTAYTQRKAALGVVDYDDLLLRWWELFATHPAIQRAYADRFEHILIDEYQDTNALQAQLITRCAATHRNLMAVGDDAQSIYSFRGADLSQLLRFPQQHAPCAVRLLEDNHRSTPPILALADACIRLNTLRFNKTLRPVRRAPDAAPPRLHAAADPHDEGAWVAQRVRDLLDRGRAPSEVAILYRAHHHALPLQAPLAAAAVPFAVRSGMRFFEQPHVKDLMALLRLSLQPLDPLASARLLQRCEGVGPARARQLCALLAPAGAHPADLSRADASARWRAPSLLRSLGARAQPTFTRLCDTLSALIASPHTHPCDLIEAAIKGFCAPTLRDAAARGAGRDPGRDPDALIRDLYQVATFAAPHLTLPDLLAAAALHANADDLTQAHTPDAPHPEAVTLSTIHQAKGLEWPVVFIVRLSDGALPIGPALSDPAALEEERRLLYVAMTRARDVLTLSFPRAGAPHQRAPTRLSRFLEEPLRHQPHLVTPWTHGPHPPT